MESINNAFEHRKFGTTASRKNSSKVMGEDQEIFKKALEQAMSEDEVNRMMLEEDLNEEQRCVTLLKKPDSRQHSYMFRNYRLIFKDNPRAQDQLIPKVLELIGKSTEQILIDAGCCFNSLLRENIILDDTLIKAIHRAAGQVVMTWSPEVLNEWRQAFILSMRVLSPIELKISIEKSMNLCDKTQPLVTRICGAYLIGKVAKYFVSGQLPIGWSQKVAAVTQDFNYEVRNVIAKQFKSIFKHLSTADLV